MSINARPESEWRALRHCLIASAIVTAIILIWSFWFKPVTYDEYYTWFEVKPGPSFSDALTQHWLRDSHPPLYYGLIYLLRQLSGQFFVLRALNAVGVLLALWAMAAIAGEHATIRLPTGLFLMAVPANPNLFASLVMLRSYALQCMVDCVILTGLCAYLIDGVLSRRSRIVLSTALILGLNLHLENSMGLAGLLGTVTIIAIRRRDRDVAQWLMAVSIASAAILITTSVFQLADWQYDATGIAGRLADRNASSIAKVLVFTAAAVLLTAPVQIVLAARGVAQMWAGRRWDSWSAAAAVLLGVGVALLGLYTAIQPVMLEPYYTILNQLLLLYAACLPAALVLQATSPKRAAVLLWAMVLTSGICQLYNLRSATAPLATEWPGLQWLSDEIAACPDTAVHVVRLDPGLYDPNAGPDAPDMLPEYLRFTARLEGIRIEPERSRRISAKCPTLFWIDDWMQPGLPVKRKEAAILGTLRKQGFAVARIELITPRQERIAIAR